MSAVGAWPGAVARGVRAWLFEAAGTNRRALARLDGTRAAVLNFHRVLPSAQAEALCVEPGMFVTPSALRMVLETLLKEVDLRPLSEIADCVISGRPFEARACAITFDDGWLDNYEYALPVLRELGVPATIFVVTDRVGTTGAFWPDEVCRRLAGLPSQEVSRIVASLGIADGAVDAQAVLEAWKGLSESERQGPLERLRAATPGASVAEGGVTVHGRELMNWDELAAMQSAGIDIESHGATHALLMHLSEAEAARELQSSLEALQAKGFALNRLFAYPSGQHSQALAEQVEAAGYRAGFALDEATATLSSDRRTIPRLGVHQGISGSRREFRAKMPGWN